MHRLSGSSPRGRGKQARVGAQVDGYGLIPAWAGKTPPPSSAPSLQAAHPRVGGENSGWATAAARSSGSSPRGRGKLGRGLGVHRSIRLIPAWAGKTITYGDPDGQGEAHPRVGGENRTVRIVSPPHAGSSPRGRGKRRRRNRPDVDSRLIPAWAGKTMTVERPRAAIWAHPRVGGENS